MNPIIKPCITRLLTLVGFLSFIQCSVGKQMQEAKNLGKCKWYLTRVDSIYLAGIDVNKLSKMDSFEDINLGDALKLGSAVAGKNVPLTLQINIDATNPTNERAAVQQMEYKILLKGNELFAGLIDKPIDVPPANGKTIVPISLQTNVFQLFNNQQTRDDLVDLINSLSGKSDSEPSALTIKIKPTLALGHRKIEYPGYLTFDQKITKEMLSRVSPP